MQLCELLLLYSASIPSLLLSPKHLHLETSLSSSQLPPPPRDRLSHCRGAGFDLHGRAQDLISLGRQKEERRWDRRTAVAAKEGTLLSHLSSFCSQISRHSLDPRPDTSLLRPVVASYSIPLLSSSTTTSPPSHLQHSSSLATFYNCTFDPSLVEDAFGCGRRRLFVINTPRLTPRRPQGSPQQSAHH